MAIERYVAAASMGLFIMFTAEILVLYNFLVGELRIIEPTPKVLQYISIGAAPASILAAVSYIMARHRGSRAIGTMLAAGGAVMAAGMAYASTVIDMADAKYHEDAVVAVPPLFAAVGIAVIAVGALLLRVRAGPARRRRPDRSSWSQSDI